MSTLCRQVHEFAEGQLDPISARAFRHHLADCVTCQHELGELLQLMGVEDELDPDAEDIPVAGASRWPDGSGQQSGQQSGYRGQEPHSPEAKDGRGGTARIIPLHRHGKLGRLARTLVPMAAAAAALLLCMRLMWRGDEAPTGSERLAQALAQARSIEGRLSYVGADRYRPYDVMRAGGQGSVEDIAISLMADMERSGDFHGLAAAELLHGNIRKAEGHLGKASKSADIDSDRALLSLLRDQPEAALLVLEPVLAANPRHAQALWNQGLALQALGLSLEAARAFEAVAELGEPGWSEEARQRAESLRRDIESREQGWRGARDAGVRLVETGQPMPEDVVQSHPGAARISFYSAVRAARTLHALEALRPLAEALDARYTTRALTAYLDRVAGEDFARRAPLAQEYGRLALGERVSGEPARALLARLRSASQEDILLGAFPYVSSELSPVERQELVDQARRLAVERGDPWLALMAIEIEVKHLIASRDPGNAEARARSALDLCRRDGDDHVCGRLYQALASAYIDQHRLSDARRYLVEGCERARRADDRKTELTCLIRFAHIAYMRNDVDGSRVALAQAYLNEYRQRIQPCADCPPDCPSWFYVHETLAGLLINQNDLDGARAQMERADALIGMGCDEPPITRQRAFALAHLLRFGGADERVARLRQALDAMRSEAARPDLRAIIDHIEGRLLIERDPETARALLGRAIAAASELAESTTFAAKARAYSYSVLIQDAGARGQYEQALALIGAEAGTPPAHRCVLGVAVEEAVLVVARDSSGAIMAERRVLEPRQRIAPAKLVPPRMSAALARCEMVDVHARSPYQGSAGLLPPHIAWRYRLSAGLAGRPELPRRTLLVSDVILPPDLDLPSLSPQAALAGVDIHLRGQGATPSRVLAHMTDATAIEIHAHGVMDPAVSDAAHLVLSRDSDGSHALTAEMLRDKRLFGAPTVILGACHGAYTPEYAHGSTSLAGAFIHSGARLVIASPAPISDAGATELFAGIRQRMAEGQVAALALRDQRRQYTDALQRAWAEGIVIFE